MLRLAADLPDGWNYDSGGPEVEEALGMMEIIRRGWARTGRRPEKFTFSLWANAFVGENYEIREQMAVHEKYGSSFLLQEKRRSYSLRRLLRS